MPVSLPLSHFTILDNQIHSTIAIAILGFMARTFLSFCAEPSSERFVGVDTAAARIRGDIGVVGWHSPSCLAEGMWFDIYKCVFICVCMNIN